MTTKIAPELLALQRLYAWESEAPARVALTHFRAAVSALVQVPNCFSVKFF